MNAAALFVQPGAKSLRAGNAEKNKKQEKTTTTTRAKKAQQMMAATMPPPDTNAPNLGGIIKQLQSDYADYKYTVYRCASKFVTLQSIFHTSKIPFKLVLAILERHGMSTSADNNNLMVPPFQLTSLVHDLYFACEQLGHFSKAQNYQLETATAQLANFFWNIFDPHRRHSISLLEIKVTFLFLCKLYSTDLLVAECYGLVADAKTKTVTKFSFEYLLNIFCKIITYVGEGKAYGAHNMQQVMEQCYGRCHNITGLTEHQFHCLWTTSHTRFLIYANLLALIKRIEDTLHLIHNNVCSGCHVERIIGIRFKCQRCRDISLCMRCFATGFSNGKHEQSHRIFEVFTEDEPPKRFSHYLARLCTCLNYMHKSHRVRSSRGRGGNRGSEAEETKGFCNESTGGGGGGANSSAVSGTELLSIPINNRSTGSGDTTTCSIIEKDEAMKTATMPTKKTATTPHACVVQQKACKVAATTAQQELSSLTGLAVTASNASERMQCIIDRLLMQNAKLEALLKMVATATHNEISLFLNAHQTFLVDIINEMRTLSQQSTNTTYSIASNMTCSTPRHSAAHSQSLSLPIATAYCDENLTHTLYGADLNRSYLEANKSDISLKDLSLWFNEQRKSSIAGPASLPVLKTLTEEDSINSSSNAFETRNSEMVNFKHLLHKVREIVEDSYSDNAELSAATQNLENVLDNIIKDEELRRRST